MCPALLVLLVKTYEIIQKLVAALSFTLALLSTQLLRIWLWILFTEHDHIYGLRLGLEIWLLSNFGIAYCESKVLMYPSVSSFPASMPTYFSSRFCYQLNMSFHCRIWQGNCINSNSSRFLLSRMVYYQLWHFPSLVERTVYRIQSINSVIWSHRFYRRWEECFYRSLLMLDS